MALPDFETQLKIGRLAETDIVRWLRSRGNSAITCYEIEHNTGKGPQFFAPTRAYVAPDILLFGGNGRVLWCEAKHKSVFTWHRISGRWTTGIDQRHYGDYQHVAQITGLPVWLLFFHVSSQPSASDLQYGCPCTCPSGLYGGSLEFLVQNENHRHGNHGRSGMVYWAEHSLKRLASVDAVRAPKVEAA